MSIEEIDAELASLRQHMQPIEHRIRMLTSERKQLASRQFIAVNKIKRGDVELSDGHGKPWFGRVEVFIEWMRKQPTQRPFAEWNKRIYFTSDLLNYLMPDMPASIRDLPL